jgi:predicted molibdopterin-dependent oxidoreductase YjgC
MEIRPDPSAERAADVEFTLDGEPVRCPEGLTVAAALLLRDRRTVRFSPRRNAPRALFCGMGVCFDCVMEIDGRAGTRSCVTLARPGMRVVTQRGVTGVAGSR